MKKLLTFSVALATCALFAQDVQDVTVPTGLSALASDLFENKVFQLGSATTMVIWAVSLLKALAPTLSTKFSGNKVYVCTAMLAMLSAIGLAVEDGMIAGSEWMSLLTATIVFAAAPFGYRMVFSTTAKEEGPVKAMKTMFVKGK